MAEARRQAFFDKGVGEFTRGIFILIMNICRHPYVLSAEKAEAPGKASALDEGRGGDGLIGGAGGNDLEFTFATHGAGAGAQPDFMLHGCSLRQCNGAEPGGRLLLE